MKLETYLRATEGGVEGRTGAELDRWPTEG